MAGLGAFLGYVLGAIDWETTQIGQLMGGNVKTIFTIVCIVLIITCTITMTSFREIPLSLIERDSLLKPLSQADIDREKNRELKVLHRITQVNKIYLRQIFDVKIFDPNHCRLKRISF